MVITVEFSDKVDLEKLSENFPGLVYRIENPRAVFLIFSSGKMNCTGATNMEDAGKATKNMLKILKNIGVKVRNPIKMKIQNIVASSKMGKTIKVDKLFDLDGIEYEPNIFPGLVHRFKGVVFLIFATGKIVCVGARTVEEIENSFNYIIEKLEKIKAL